LSCADSDAAIRALLAAYPDARDIEIVAAGLEQAFLELTGDGAGDGVGEYPSAGAAGIGGDEDGRGSDGRAGSGLTGGAR
jgi:ABC-2 type transport system ATP-binding protein